MKEKILALLSKSQLEPFVADAVATLIDREFIVQERPKRYRVERVEGPGYRRMLYGYGAEERYPRLKWLFFDREKKRDGGYPPYDAIFYDMAMAMSFWETLPPEQREPFIY